MVSTQRIPDQNILKDPKYYSNMFRTGRFPSYYSHNFITKIFDDTINPNDSDYSDDSMNLSSIETIDDISDETFEKTFHELMDDLSDASDFDDFIDDSLLENPFDETLDDTNLDDSYDKFNDETFDLDERLSKSLEKFNEKINKSGTSILNTECPLFGDTCWYLRLNRCYHRKMEPNIKCPKYGETCKFIKLQQCYHKKDYCCNT